MATKKRVLLTRGRKPKLTADLEKRLLGILSAGVPRVVACPAVGISDRTLRIWVERAAKGETKYVDFLEKLDTAIASSKVGLVLTLRRHAETDWKAGAFLLERTDHATFGPKAPTQASTDNTGGPLEIVIRRATPTAESGPDATG